VRRGRVVNRPTEAGGRFSRRVRGQESGLLILYPINPSKEKAECSDVPVLGFAISFPEVDSSLSTPVDYIVGNVFQRVYDQTQIDDDDQ